MASEEWKDISQKAQKILADSIPTEWRISADKLPSSNQANVTDFPAKSGILSKDELKITESFATEIIENVADKTWKAGDVTRAFCKRAAIAHQVVGLS